jgi:uncharacterized repeat protein (TIGR03803 family)
MTNPAQVFMSVVNRILRKLFFALAVVCTLTSLGLQAAQAQTFSVIHNFTGGADGYEPFSGLNVAPSGSLYGTAVYGGTGNAGTVFKLTLHGSSWVFSPLYEFTGGSDGANPLGGVVIGPNGALYGTTQSGGSGYGTVFELRPPATFCRSVRCYWNETVLYAFMEAPDGEYPHDGNLAFDQEGNIYGTTTDGGMYGYGTTFELTPSGGGYTESIIHTFDRGTDGANPESGLLIDTAGNLYGNTLEGGTGGYGTVYQLKSSDGGWLENVLVNFDQTNGSTPGGNLITDGSGNLYGATSAGGQNGEGVVYKLAPLGGGFTYSELYTFSSLCGLFSGVALDAAGNFFGVCYGGGDPAYQDGWIFELTNCSQGCSVVDLHDFSGRDGAQPWGTPVLDANGDLYGTTVNGGTGRCSGGCGVVWEIAGVGARHKN